MWPKRLSMSRPRTGNSVAYGIAADELRVAARDELLERRLDRELVHLRLVVDGQRVVHVEADPRDARSSAGCGCRRRGAAAGCPGPARARGTRRAGGELFALDGGDLLRCWPRRDRRRRANDLLNDSGSDQAEKSVSHGRSRAANPWRAQPPVSTWGKGPLAGNVSVTALRRRRSCGRPPSPRPRPRPNRDAPRGRFAGAPRSRGALSTG